MRWLRPSYLSPSPSLPLPSSSSSPSSFSLSVSCNPGKTSPFLPIFSTLQVLKLPIHSALLNKEKRTEHKWELSRTELIGNGRSMEKEYLRIEYMCQLIDWLIEWDWRNGVDNTFIHRISAKNSAISILQSGSISGWWIFS